MTLIYFAVLLGVSHIYLARCQSFTKQPQPVLGFKGSQAVFECQASGLTNPVYYWKKDSVNVTRGNSEFKNSVATLTIPGLTFGDTGDYVCVAVGGTTLMSGAASLEVKGPPDIVQSPSAISPHVGQTAVFICVTIGNPTPVVTWTNPSNQLIIPGGRFDVYGNGSLIISNLQKADAGYYTCKSENNLGPTSAFAELTVLDAPVPPVFSTTPANQTAREGTDVTFYCEATGVPKPSITWGRVGGVIPSQRRDEPRPGALRIKNVLPPDDGTYVCNATNTQGMKQAFVYLRIEGYPRFAVSPSDVTITEYSQVILNCVVTGDPTPTVTWVLPSGGTVTSATASPVRGVQVLANNTLVISNVTEIHHGEYACSAINIVGQRRQTATVSVLTIPRFNAALSNVTNTINGDVQITCPSRGNPEPRTQWIFGGKIVSMLQTLTLTSLNVSNQGYYTCRANSSQGDAQESFYLRVMVPPSIVRAPVNQTLPLGTTVYLGCQTTGDPLPVVTWETLSGSVAWQPRYTVAANGTLKITLATHADMGWLTCKAASAAGTVKAKAYLIVSDLPVFTQLPSNQTLVKGNPITLQCRATAADSPKITWYKADQSGALQKVVSSAVTLASGDLQFAAVTRHDKGLYACQACNAAGCKMTPQIQLNVLYNPLFPVPPSDVGVVRGQDAKLECKPDSSPQATISWTRPDGTVMPGTGYEQTIRNVQPEDTGVYKCSARNDYGSTGEQSITLRIQTRTGITDIVKQTTSTDLVTCDVTGTPTPSIVWYLGNVTLPQNALYPEYSVTRESKLRVPIGALENNTFVCNASNPHAVVVYLVKVPLSPPNVTATSVTSSSMMVTWLRPSPLTYLVTHYQLDMWSADASWKTLSNNTGNQLSYSVPNLISFTTYRFRVRAVNGLGASENSLPSENITSLSSEPSVPRNVRLTTERSNASIIIVTWSVPQHLNGPLGNLQYHVTHLPSVPNATNEFRFAHDSMMRPQEFKIAGLLPDTMYGVVVRAGRRRAVDGWELWSAGVDTSVRTPQLVPVTPPIGLTITSNGGSQIMLKWKTPPYSISGYYIYYKVHKSGQKYTFLYLRDGSASTYVIMDLQENTQYEVRIQMYSNSGIGPLSLAQTVTTEVDTFGAGYSTKDQGLSWKIAVGGLVSGLLLLAIVIVIVWYRKRTSTDHRQSFRISAARNRPDYLVRSHTTDAREDSIGGIHNDALDVDVDLGMFEHGTYDTTADQNDRRLEHMDPSDLQFGDSMMQEVPVAGGDQDVCLESYSPRDTEGHYDEVRQSARSAVRTLSDNVPESDLRPAGSINGMPVYAEVDKAAKNNRRSSKDPEWGALGSLYPDVTESVPERAPTYDSVDHTAPGDEMAHDTQSDLENAPVQDNEPSPESPRDSPVSEHLNNNEPSQQSVDIPPFPQRKDTTASEVSIEFPPPPPIETLPPEEREPLERLGSLESDFSDSPPSEVQAPTKPPRTFEEYQDDGVPPVDNDEPLSDKGPRKRRMVADWGEDAPMDNLWEQLDKELDMRLGT